MLPTSLLSDTPKVESFNKDLSHSIVTKLSEFDIKVHIIGKVEGPVVTNYHLKLGKGIKVKELINLEADLELALGVKSLKISYTPGNKFVSLEVSNESRQIVDFKRVIEGASLEKNLDLPIALGVNTENKVQFADLAKMPHLLIGGSTGSGKSVGLHTILLSLLYQFSSEELKLVLIDPKRLELSAYTPLPHLLFPVIIDSQEAVKALEWAEKEMEARYSKLQASRARDIKEYNAANFEKMPYIVIVIDELSDLIMTSKRAVEYSLTRLTQMARSVGIHLIVATQRPSVDIISGVVKNNFPSRIAFRVVSAIDSKTILNYGGAEKLLGNGDMLYLSSSSPDIQRLHGSFVPSRDIKTVVNYIVDNSPPQEFLINQFPEIFCGFAAAN